ncbi:hypothetical protein H5185_08860 [Shewanella sp. SG44-6]|uniref:hypothetical protein n=1 Tax=Shewanella sp. SG44-6 TaxID=2760959 RepID=UPI0016013DF4|nr:hypothetical protein [Shewanella sp. SG44-6]MBB1389532.1 hypothetical protein [Shewanella sp. SG44-6]
MAIVMAIALKSFYFVKEVKTKQSKPFEVEQHNFNELKALGMVDHAPEDEAALQAKADEEAALKAKADEEAALKAKADEETALNAKADEEAALKAKADTSKKTKA